MLAPFVQDFSNDKLNGFRQDDALLPGRLSGLEKDSIQVNVSNVPSLESNLVSDEEKSSSSEHVSPSAPLNLSSNSTAEQEVQVLAVAEHDERDEEKNDEDEDAFSHSRRSIVHSHLDLQSPFGVRIEARFCCPHIGNRLTFLDEFVQHKILPIVSQLSSLKGIIQFQATNLSCSHFSACSIPVIYHSESSAGFFFSSFYFEVFYSSLL